MFETLKSWFYFIIMVIFFSQFYYPYDVLNTFDLHLDSLTFQYKNLKHEQYMLWVRNSYRETMANRVMQAFT